MKKTKKQHSLIDFWMSFDKIKIKIMGVKISLKCKILTNFILKSFIPTKLKWYLYAKWDKDEIMPMWQYEIRYHKFNFEEIRELFKFYDNYPKNILSVDETIDYIIKNKVSVSRIGDGEELLHNILGYKCKYIELKEKLINIMKNGSNKNCLVCINSFIPANSDATVFTRNVHSYYWPNVVKFEKFKNLKFDNENMYGDAYSFLFYFKDNDTEKIREEKKRKIRQIWQNKKVLFVVNEHSAIISDKTEFNDVKEKSYIFIPSHDAYSEYYKIFNEIKKYDKDWLIYIEAGACATVLAYELSSFGYQALDIGGYYSRIILDNFRNTGYLLNGGI